jgi:hypothetical protein
MARKQLPLMSMLMDRYNNTNIYIMSFVKQVFICRLFEIIFYIIYQICSMMFLDHFQFHTKLIRIMDVVFNVGNKT